MNNLIAIKWHCRHPIYWLVHREYRMRFNIRFRSMDQALQSARYWIRRGYIAEVWSSFSLQETMRRFVPWFNKHGMDCQNKYIARFMRKTMRRPRLSTADLMAMCSKVRQEKMDAFQWTP